MSRLTARFLAFLFLCSPILALSQSYEQLDPYFSAMAEQRKFTGSVLVAEGGSVVYHKGFGPAAANGQTKNTADSQFLIGSITKTFTAVAVMQLFEAGKISLSDPLSKYISLFPNAEKITVRHLLSHKTGIKNYTELPDISQWIGNQIPPLRLIEKVMDHPLAFEPGSMYSYSNTNYVILGIIIEQTSGMSYQDYLKKNVLERAGLDDTGMDYDKAKNLSSGLVWNGEAWQPAAKVDASVPFSAGALYSSTGDMYTFSKAFFAGDFFNDKSTLEAMMNFDEGFYGLGVYAEQIDEEVYFGHNGNIDGYAAAWHYFKDLDMHAIVLSNSMESQNDQAMDAIVHARLGKMVDIPQPKKLVQLPVGKLEKMTGTYALQKGFDIDVFLENGKLMSKATGQGAFELFAENDSSFFANVGGIELVFHQKGKEQANSLTLFQSGGEYIAERKDSHAAKKPLELPLADLKILEGRYQLQEGFDFKIFVEGSTLFGQASGQSAFELIPENRQDFYTEGLGISVSFVFGDDGEPESLILYQNGGKYEAQKMDF